MSIQAAMATASGATLVVDVVVVVDEKNENKTNQNHEMARIFRNSREQRTAAPPSPCKRGVIP